jgi:hypothetical protein
MTPEEHLLLRDLLRESCRPCPYWHSKPVQEEHDSLNDINWLTQRIIWLKQQQGMIGLGKQATSSHVVPE